MKGLERFVPTKMGEPPDVLEANGLTIWKSGMAVR